jgi:hypothetical protein
MQAMVEESTTEDESSAEAESMEARESMEERESVEGPESTEEDESEMSTRAESNGTVASRRIIDPESTVEPLPAEPHAVEKTANNMMALRPRDMTALCPHGPLEVNMSS